MANPPLSYLKTKILNFSFSPESLTSQLYFPDDWCILEGKTFTPIMIRYEVTTLSFGLSSLIHWALIYFFMFFFGIFPSTIEVKMLNIEGIIISINIIIPLQYHKRYDLHIKMRR